MKVTLLVNGREMTFSEDELVQIVEEHFSSENSSKEELKETQVSTENQWIDVNPELINQKVFEKKRSDIVQERTRLLILEALEAMKKEPKYREAFQIMMPSKGWKVKTFREMNLFAHQKGGHITNWIELALYWAQKLSNGESWESLCNKPDTANWNRIVVWKDGVALVGGSVKEKSRSSAVEADVFDYLMNIPICDAVPSITRKKQK